MLSCYEATRLMSEARERSLSFKERLALRLHTAMCSGCRHFGRHMETIHLAMRGFAKGGHPPESDDSEKV